MCVLRVVCNHIPTYNLSFKLFCGLCVGYTVFIVVRRLLLAQWVPTMSSPCLIVMVLLPRPIQCWTLSRWMSRVLMFQSYVANCVFQRPPKSRLWRCQPIIILPPSNGVSIRKRRYKGGSWQKRHAVSSAIGAIRRFMLWVGR